MKRKWFPGLLDFSNHIKNKKILDWARDSSMVKPMFGVIMQFFRLINLPGLRRIHPWVQPEKTEMYILPVNESLERGEDVILPYQIVEQFIERFSHHVIMEFCGCRNAYRCEEYPQDIGCLMMGEDSKKIKTPWARRVTREEAKAHVKRAVEAGLPPFIGKIRVDNFLFGIPESNKLFTVCFCCDCCCLGRMYRYMPAENRNLQMKRLEGLTVWVDEEKCEGCGTCAEHCFLDLITISEEGKSQIPDDCRGCGRCARYCPNGAIHVRLDNPGFVNQVVGTLENLIEVS